MKRKFLHLSTFIFWLTISLWGTSLFAAPPQPSPHKNATAQKSKDKKTKVQKQASSSQNALSKAQASKKDSEVTDMLAEKFRKQYWDRGPLLALLLIFIMGFLVSLTPCVYPMIPITIAMIGASGSTTEKKRGRGMMLSLTYVLGMAFPAVILGVVVTTIGKLPFMLGGLMQSALFLGAIIVIFFLMSLSMFGLFDIAIPASWQTKLASVQGKGFLGVFLLGMIGIVLSTPCSGPVLIGLFAFLVQAANPFLGILLPFVFVLGIGVPFFVLGAGVVESLPQSGKWMVEIKKIFGVILLGASFYYAYYLFRSHRFIYGIVLGVTFILLGYLAGAFKGPGKLWWWLRVKQGIGILWILIGGYLIIGLAFHSQFASSDKPLPFLSNFIPHTHTQQAHASCLPPANYPKNKVFWFTSEKEGMKCAKKLKRPVIIDFWADWCTSCKHLSKKSFGHPDVVKESRRFVMIKVEYSEDNPQGRRLKKLYKVQGLPWVRFINSKGKLLSKPLIIGFKDHNAVLKMMQSVH